MNFLDKEEIDGYLFELNRIHIEDLIIETFPDIPFDKIEIGKLDAFVFKTLFEEVRERLNNLMNSSIVGILPQFFTYNIEETNGSWAKIRKNIYIEIDSFISCIKRRQFESSEEYLGSIFYYCSIFSNWDKTERPLPKEKDLKAIEDRQKILQQKIDIDIEKLEDLFKDFDNYRKGTANHIIDLELTLQRLHEKEQSIQQSSSEIDAKLAVSKQNEEDINELKKKITQHETTISNNIDKYSKAFDKIQKENTSSYKLMKEAEKLQEEIESKRAEIENLLGAAADGSLGTKFDNRKTALQKNVNWLLGFVISSLVVTVGWVLYIFWDFDFKKTGIDLWSELIVGVLRTLPAWFLVWWLINRYSEERRLQEEYAFKASVAMAMRSHSALLKSNDKGTLDERSSNQRMLLKTFENLYKEPYLGKSNNREKQTNMNQINELLKQVAELIKETNK